MRTNAVRAAALLVLSLGTSGCYLAHLAAGQARLLRARQPIEALLADPSTPPELRARLELTERAREFAAGLGLDVGGQYTSYVPWPGDRVVTSVVATRAGELEPAGFSYPFLGRLPYKGFFDRERAEAEAERLRARGLDVCEVGVRAYSTLGWFDDPVTGPMLRGDEGAVVEVIVHELVHATVYVPGDADFNEGVASFIGEEGAVQFYAGSAHPERARRERQRVDESRQIEQAILQLRAQVAALYAREPAGPGRDAARRDVERRARERIAELPLASYDAADLVASLQLNDACLALAGTYSADLDAYAARLAELDGDLRAFVARLRHAAEASDPRAALLAD
ncbi:MAG: aminopeptidase [Myxococcota bacterium]